MQEFLFILIIVFILFGVFRRMMFGSFYAAMQKHQREQERKIDEERKRKREGKVIVEKLDSKKSISDDGFDYTDYEELK